MQKCTRSSLKIYTGIPRYPNPYYPDPGARMILISVQVSPSVSKLRNHSLKFRNQIDSDYMLAYYPNPFYSNSLCDLSLLNLASILNHKYAVCFIFLWLNDTNYLEGYISFISFCVLVWNKFLHLYLNQYIVSVLRVMIDFKQSHPTVNNLVQMILSYSLTDS